MVVTNSIQLLTLITLGVGLTATVGKVYFAFSRIDSRIDKIAAELSHRVDKVDLKADNNSSRIQDQLLNQTTQGTIIAKGVADRIEHVDVRLKTQLLRVSSKVDSIEKFLIKTTEYESRD